jgi:hypothetical protein
MDPTEFSWSSQNFLSGVILGHSTSVTTVPRAVCGIAFWFNPMPATSLQGWCIFLFLTAKHFFNSLSVSSILISLESYPSGPVYTLSVHPISREHELGTASHSQRFCFRHGRVTNSEPRYSSPRTLPGVLREESRSLCWYYNLERPCWPLLPPLRKKMQKKKKSLLRAKSWRKMSS